MRVSLTKDKIPFSKDIFEERIQETKNQIRMENQLKEIDLNRSNEGGDNDLEFGYDSGRKSSSNVPIHEFNNKLRQSLNKLRVQ